MRPDARMSKPLLIFACVVALVTAGTVLTWWARADDAIHLGVISDSHGPINLPFLQANSAAVELSVAHALLGQPMEQVIRQLGKPSYDGGEMACWWSMVKSEPGRSRHLRIDYVDQVATRVTVLTDVGVEEAVWKK